jgi:chemotaxis regulatin CheY-phosphate phosphatase CheZ
MGDEQVVKRFTGTISVITEPLYSVFIAQASLSLDSASTSEEDDVHSGPYLQTQLTHVALLLSDKCSMFTGGK